MELKFFWKATTMIMKKAYNIYLCYMFIFKSVTQHVQTKALYKTEYKFCLQTQSFFAAALKHHFFPSDFFHSN